LKQSIENANGAREYAIRAQGRARRLGLGFEATCQAGQVASLGASLNGV